MNTPEVWLPKGLTTVPLPLTSSQPYDLLGRLSTPKFVLDLGCGRNDSPVSKQVRSIPCQFLCSVDSWQPYLEFITREPFLAQQHERVQLDVTNIPKGLTQVFYDLCLCLDVVEHLPKEVGRRLLKRLTMFANGVLIWIPIGEDPVRAWDDNPGQNHRATWEVSDLIELGYAVQVFKSVHTKTPPVDAAWAWKAK